MCSHLFQTTFDGFWTAPHETTKNLFSHPQWKKKKQKHYQCTKLVQMEMSSTSLQFLLEKAEPFLKIQELLLSSSNCSSSILNNHEGDRVEAGGPTQEVLVAVEWRGENRKIENDDVMERRWNEKRETTLKFPLRKFVSGFSRRSRKWVFFIKETTRQFLSALKRSFGLFCLEDVAHSLFSERRVDILLMCVHLFSDTITQTLQSTKISKRLSKLFRFLLQRIVEFRRKCKIAAALLFRTIFPFFFFFCFAFSLSFVTS